jgi:hypothetical protein
VTVFHIHMLQSSRHHPRQPWVAELAAMMAICLAVLLPSLHAQIGCEDHRQDHAGNQGCESNCTADRETSPTDSQAPHNHHDPSDCDLCKLIFTLDSSVMHPLAAEVHLVGVSTIDTLVFAAQVDQPAAPLDVRRTRGPPEA